MSLTKSARSFGEVPFPSLEVGSKRSQGLGSLGVRLGEALPAIPHIDKE